MLTAQANHLREMAYTVERVKNDAIDKLSLSGSITLATAAMDMRDAADTIAQLRNTCNDLQRENAKLRELVIEQKRLADAIHAYWAGGKAPEQFDALMRVTARVDCLSKELGIEVKA
jgi:hypothetical protein